MLNHTYNPRDHTHLSSVLARDRERHHASHLGIVSTIRRATPQKSSTLRPPFQLHSETRRTLSQLPRRHHCLRPSHPVLHLHDSPHAPS
jgi:hypothetical protein